VIQSAEDNIYRTDILVIRGEENMDRAVKFLRINYPVGKLIKCYYNYEDKTYIRLAKTDSEIYLIFVWVFVAFGILILIMWTLCFIRNCIIGHK
jgi:hypothetical protein